MTELATKCQELLDTLKKNIEFVGSEEELKTKYSKGYKKLINSINECVKDIIGKKTDALIVSKEYGDVVKEIIAYNNASISEAIRTYDVKNVEAAVDDLYYDIVTIADEGVTRKRWNTELHATQK